MIDDEITQEYFRKEVIKGKEIGGKGWIELSVWDFAGQQDYYNNHHYFISTRTVFLVLWKMSEGDEIGMKGLDFWFRSLATHLVSSPSPSPSSSTSPASDTTSSTTYYSIMVVGTFLDHPNVKKDEKSKEERRKKIEGLAKESGLNCVIQCYEVSCSSSHES